MPAHNKKLDKMNFQLPAITGTVEYSPSRLQLKTLIAYLQALSRGEVIKPYETLRKCGHSVNNWYKWTSTKPLFVEWFNACVKDFHARTGLGNVHLAVYREALGNSAQDRKLYLERFDKDYKPQVRTELDVDVGRRPADVEELRKLHDERLNQLSAEVAK